MGNVNCPLCRSESSLVYSRDDRRDYFQCAVCRMVFVPPGQFLSPEAEKKRYDLHQNSPEDPGYRAYLNRLFIPMQEHLRLPSRGLDFGSGPSPTLSAMFKDAGHAMSLYDPHYAPDSGPLHSQYDFIAASEVVEHLRDPGSELKRLWSCLKPGGVLGIMTQFIVSPDEFPEWYYKKDPTHICFYSPEVFIWLTNRWKAKILLSEKGVVILRKND